MSRPRSTKSPSNKPPSSATTRRLFTQKDEIHLLKSLLNPSVAKNPFRDDRQFSDAQISDKIRRLKQKYHKLAKSKLSTKTPHDREIYEIARGIWGKEKTEMPPPAPKAEEERKKKRKVGESSGESEINWSDYPFMMREVSRAFSGIEEMYKQGLRGLGEDILKGFEEKWKNLAIEEAEIRAKTIELRCKT